MPTNTHTSPSLDQPDSLDRVRVQFTVSGDTARAIEALAKRFECDPGTLAKRLVILGVPAELSRFPELMA